MMKKYMKIMLSVVFCAGLMQSPLQASPFKDFCRKWVPRAVTVGYWGVLSAPGLYAMHSHINGDQEKIWRDINGSDKNNRPFFYELKEYAPEKYAEMNALHREAGLPGLDDCPIKVITEDGSMRLASVSDLAGTFVENYYDQACCMGKNRILIGEPLINETIKIEHKNGVYVETVVIKPPVIESTAAVLAHEKEHSDKNHRNKRVVLISTVPFMLHASFKGIASIISISTSGSLLRIPQAGAILYGTVILGRWYSRKCEREADASVKNSPKLALKAAEYFQALEQRPYGFVECLEATHPHPSERAAYLQKWAAEAKAKKKQEANK